MASGAFWAADSIATQLQANANAARSASAMKHQQGFHCGDISVQRAALRELARLEPGNHLLIDVVQQEIYRDAEREFWRHGWKAGSSHEADPHKVHAGLLSAFEAKRAELVQQVQAQAVHRKRRGWWWARRDVFLMLGAEHPTRASAEQAKTARLDSIASAQLGEQL